jgi:hypothetical protein
VPIWKILALHTLICLRPAVNLLNPVLLGESLRPLEITRRDSVNDGFRVRLYGKDKRRGCNGCCSEDTKSYWCAFGAERHLRRVINLQRKRVLLSALLVHS